MELLWKCLIWYYEYTLELEYARVLNLAGIHKVLNMREYALEQCLNMSEYAWDKT